MFAQTVEGIINYTIKNAVQPAIGFLIVLATVVFIWGVIEFIAGADNEKARTQGKQHIIWGLIGLFIMVAASGLMWVIVNFWTSADMEKLPSGKVCADPSQCKSEVCVREASSEGVCG